MLRHASLIPLSHQHQHGLALCVKIDRGLAADSSPEKVARFAATVKELFELELKNHFEVEEKILFPAIRSSLGEAPIVDDLVAEHRQIEGLVARLPETLAEFSALLQAHIRREERELFETIQQKMPPEELDHLAGPIKDEVVRVCF